MELNKRILLTLLVAFIVVSCSPRAVINRELKLAETSFGDHKGFLLFDPQSGKDLVAYHSRRYFTPASNTKIFTLYTSLQLLGDSIPALHYIERNDSLIFWGTGDPSFLYREVYQLNRVFEFLKNAPAQLAFSSGNFHDERFGPGWAWDDYEYSFSPERSAFPIYGNLVSFTDSVNNELKVVPKIFSDSITLSKDVSEKKKITRYLTANQFTFESSSTSKSITQEIPLKINDQLIASLLSDTLNRSVGIIDIPLPPTRSTLYSVPPDSLYKVMMQESDNFIADQLLLMSAGMLSDSLKAGIAIEYMKENWLADLGDEPIWVDGSGLSRYNLFTPHAVVRLWNKLLRQLPQERLFALLATGGEAGTIKNLYRNERPFIYGKTGTLSNNHCLSGYLVTKREKVLIFSFMNNNYTTSTNEVRQMMDKILRIAHEKY